MTTDLQTLKATAQATADKSPDLLVTVPAGVMLELLRDVERYRFVSRLAWYVDRAAQVYDLCNVNSNWATERGSPDEDEVEDAIDKARAKEKQ